MYRRPTSVFDSRVAAGPRSEGWGRLRRTGTLVALFILAPLLLGVLFVGPTPPAGRTSRSATRVGHKALYELLGAYGFRVRRFERGVETPPAEPAVFVALEPGPSLFREGGQYARGLADWIARGHAALLTLGRIRGVAQHLAE